MMPEQNQTGTPPSNALKKKLKKQAKREARAMQALEEARSDFQKAQQKLAKATRTVQKQQEILQANEAKLEEIRSTRRALQAETETPWVREGAGAQEQQATETAGGVEREIAEEIAAEERTTEVANEIVREMVEKEQEVEEKQVEEAVREIEEEQAEEAINEIVQEMAATEAFGELAQEIAREEQAEALAGLQHFDANETASFPREDENATRDLVEPGKERLTAEDILVMNLQAITEQREAEQADKEPKTRARSRARSHAENAQPARRQTRRGEKANQEGAAPLKEAEKQEDGEKGEVTKPARRGTATSRHGRTSTPAAPSARSRSTTPRRTSSSQAQAQETDGE